MATGVLVVGVPVVGALAVGALLVFVVGVLVAVLVDVLVEVEGVDEVLEEGALPPPPQEASKRVAKAAQERARKEPGLKTTFDMVVVPLEK